MSSAVQLGNRLIESKRKADNAYREMDAVIAQDRKTLQIAKFENTTTQKIDRRTKQQMYESKKKEYEENLLYRRKKLAQLYNDEMEAWKLEVLSKVETVEDRKQRIMERAYALRDAREKTRQEYVQQRYDDQWRASCDDARTLDSKAMVKFMNDERIRQIREKIDRKQQLSHQEDSFLAEYNRQMEELERRDKEKAEYRRRVDRETSEAVLRQIEDNERMKIEYYRKMKEDDDRELEKLRQDIEADEDTQRRRREEAINRGREVQVFNSENRKLREEEKYIETEQDAILLDYALRKETEQIAFEEAKKNANRQAALQYRKYLEEQMIKEAEDTAFIDEVRRKEEEKVWKARDEALQAREDARNYLMKMVDEGRQEQIRHRNEQLIKEKDEDRKFVKKFMDEANDAVRKDREDIDSRRRLNMDNNQQLMKQIDLKKHKEELERQEIYLADKEMKYRERLHQQRLAEQAGNLRLNFPLQKNNWYT